MGHIIIRPPSCILQFPVSTLILLPLSLTFFTIIQAKTAMLSLPLSRYHQHLYFILLLTMMMMMTTVVRSWTTMTMTVTTRTMTRKNLQRFSYLSPLFGGANEVDPGIVEGTDLRIVKYPHPALRAPNQEITLEELKESNQISDLAKGMLKVMYATEGVGLAAPQVGVNKRLMVYNPTGDYKRWLDETILINPKIVEYSEGTDTETEGCLSFPDMSGDVLRSKWIKVQAMNLKGKSVKKKFTGWEARIFQHEYDHLDGTVYIDRLTEHGREQVQPRLDQLIQEFGDGGAL